jgi:hypothetical protein
MPATPRPTLEDSYTDGLSCAICGHSELSIVHNDRLPDFVACGKCGSAFVVEGDGERVMYGKIDPAYPDTSRFALREWAWLEAVARKADLERQAGEAAGEPDLPTPIEPEMPIEPEVMPDELLSPDLVESAATPAEKPTVPLPKELQGLEPAEFGPSAAPSDTPLESEPAIPMEEAVESPPPEVEELEATPLSLELPPEDGMLAAAPTPFMDETREEVSLEAEPTPMPSAPPEPEAPESEHEPVTPEEELPEVALPEWAAAPGTDETPEPEPIREGMPPKPPPTPAELIPDEEYLKAAVTPLPAAIQEVEFPSEAPPPAAEVIPEDEAPSTPELQLREIDPPPGQRSRVVIKGTRVRFPSGFCAHCMRKPAKKKLGIPGSLPNGQALGNRRATIFTLPLCRECHKRASKIHEDEKNARLQAHLVSALCAMVLLVAALAWGLDLREEPLIGILIIATLATVGYAIPALILLGRIRPYPPPPEANYIRSTLHVQAETDTLETAFEWRNKDYAERFYKSNKESVLGRVTSVKDRAPNPEV